MKLYKGTLYRFGGEITCTDKDTFSATYEIMKVYCEMFKKAHYGEDPKKELCNNPFNATATWYENAKDDIEWEEIEIGKAEYR